MFHLLQIWTHQDKKEGKRKKKRRGRSKWNAEVQKADSPPIPLIPPIRLCHTQGQGVWGRLAGGQAVKALHSLTWATIQRVTHPLPEESLIQSRSLQVLLIIKYTHVEQELYFKIRLFWWRRLNTTKASMLKGGRSTYMQISTLTWTKIHITNLSWTAVDTNRSH